MATGKLSYLSPSSYKFYEADPELFFQKYILRAIVPEIADKLREPQTLAMAVGSSFDAYIKSHLHQTLFGKNHKDSDKFIFEKIYESQVEQQNRPLVLQSGKFIFNEYIKLGCLADLLLDLEKSLIEPRFEIEVKGSIYSEAEDKMIRESLSKSSAVNYFDKLSESDNLKSGVPSSDNLKSGVPGAGVPGSDSNFQPLTILGRPDLYFVNSEGAEINHDFKVNGFYSKSNTSPGKEYLKCRQRDCKYETEDNNFKMLVTTHKGFLPLEYKGVKINSNYLENINKDWAIQLTCYNWLFGAKVGVENIGSIDQICGNPNLGFIRIAIHRARISSAFQKDLYFRMGRLWNLCMAALDSEKGILAPQDSWDFWFFRNLSKEDSIARCKTLMEIVNSADDELFKNLFG